MAVTEPTDFSPNSFGQEKLSISQYKALGDWIDEVNKPDNRDKLVRTYGNQSISGVMGLLSMVGAVKHGGTNDEVTWWEEPRLHTIADGTMTAVVAGATTTATVTSAAHKVKVGDAVLIEGVEVASVVGVTNANTFTVAPYETWTQDLTGAVKISVVFNEYPQGSDQPTHFIASNLVKRTNPYMILKSIFAVTGSQLGNVSWVQDPDTGKPYWHLKQEKDANIRFQDHVEMAAILGKVATNATLTTANLNGSEGVFSAVEKRGIRQAGYISNLSDVDTLIKALDAQAGIQEYAGFFNRQQQFNLDDMIADAAGAAGANSSYGMFNNDKEMAVNLGFSSFTRGSYTFHNKSWKLLNDPQLLGRSDHYKGILIPQGAVTDAKTGIQSPYLEINVKGYPSNDMGRYMERFVTGGVNGVYTNGRDTLEYNQRTECNVVTRGANNFVLIAG